MHYFGVKTKITTEMKKLLLFTTVLGLLASCEIYIFDEQFVEWDERDLFVGDYRVEELSQTTDQFYVYNINIRKSCCIDNKIRISNFYGVGINVHAYVNDTRITVPWQRVDSYEIEGTGKMINNRLFLTFIVRDFKAIPSFTDFVDAEGRPY